MGVLSGPGKLIERRLFGGTADDYWALMQSSAQDYELRHEDPELERTLPRVALGEALATWSVVPGSASRVSSSTWFRPISDRARYAAVLEPLGLDFAGLSIAATCRLDPRDPLATVQVTRYRGADEAALRRVVAAGNAMVTVAGVALEMVGDLRVRPVPGLSAELAGYRLVRGDTIYEIAAPGLAHAEAPPREGGDPWLDDVVEQLVNGPRFPSPRFALDLPDGWIGAAIGGREMADIEAVLQRRPGHSPGENSPFALAPGTTFVAIDAADLELPMLPSLRVWERRTIDASFEDEIEDWRQAWSQRAPGARLQHLSLDAARAARLAFQFQPRPEVQGWGQSYVVRAGGRTFRFDFATIFDRRSADGPVFDAMIQGCRFLT